MSPPSRPFRPLRAAIAFILISAVFVPARAGCPAATVRLRAAPQPNELPRRVVANRDASIAPLDYFFMPEDGNLGAGAFGSVSVGQLKGARPTGLTEGEDYLREFAIKYQKWYSPPIDAWAENLTAYASFSEVHLMRQVAGGPYLAKFWGNWSVAPCTHRGVRKLHSFSIALTKAATTLDKEARERANAKFFPRQSGGIPEADVKKIVAQIAVAVGWLHQNGIIHRDLKMPNILLDGAGRVMLGDFGCAIRNSDILTGRPPEMPEVRARMSPLRK
ncbi:kinase-like domain-containing protein [Hyaloraphidium curvatum]|nr:kinase-like domain-containing protein [Hyaloraphidium curvatum]